MFTKIRKKMQKREGFTLIELMIVIAILGVLAAVAIPYYNQYIENSKMRISRSNYEAGIRTVKAEFANVVAGNPATTNLINILNDYGKNKNPFLPSAGAFTLGAGAAAANRGQVWVSRANFSGLALLDTVSIQSVIDKLGTVVSTTLTYQ